MKSKQNGAPSPHPRQLFLEWYHSTTLGQVLQKNEASYLQNAIKLTYYQNILQVGQLGSEPRFIGEEFRHNFALIVGHSDCDAALTRRVCSNMDELPIANESVDIVILPHILEFEHNPHQVLREADRILKAEGRLFVLGFNPLSLHGIVSRLPRQHTFLQKNFISPYRLMDWLNLLKFEAEFSVGFGLATSQAIFKPDTLISKSLAYLATAYAVSAVKRTYTVIPIKPAWRSASGLMPGHAVDTPVLRRH